MTNWHDKKVLVTGGAGFIGSHLVERLLAEGTQVIVADKRPKKEASKLGPNIKRIEYMTADLLTLSECEKACEDIEVIFNLAARVGGVKYNMAHPGTMFTENALINTNMLEAARRKEVEKFLCMSSACVYPRYCSIPTPEEEGFKDEPEQTNRGYGWAKRIAEVQAKAYAEEFDMKIAIVRPYNAYGPRDHFNTETGHVIAALIKKVFDDMNPLVIWGDGTQTRCFVYVTDIVRGLLLATEKYAVADPLNIGTDEEVKIKDLAEMIVRISGAKTKIVFDTTKPAGQPRRKADTRKAKEKIGYTAEVSLQEGLKKTIDWYRDRNDR
jgi:GDP-L-fucose synthase